MTRYVGIAQQGTILDQRIVETGHDRNGVFSATQDIVDKMNQDQQGYSEAYVPVVLEIPEGM